MDLKKFIEYETDFNQDRKLIKYYLYQILSGIAYCHHCRVLHRDLKPQNILINRHNNCIKLADFGLGRAFGTQIRAYTHHVVTLWYRAPEILLGARHYGTPMDIWSVGCIFAEMLIGAPLFPGDSEIDELYKIFYLLGTPTELGWPGVTTLTDYCEAFPKWSSKGLEDLIHDLDDAGFDLLHRMLSLSPSQRISAEEALQHEYFTDLFNFQ